MALNLPENLGRIFEVGFNIGILTYIEQQQLQHKFGNSYRQDLSKLPLAQILKEIVKDLTAPESRQIAEKWTKFVLFKGFLGGLNFFREYLDSTGWKPHKLQILYYQCRFDGDNSLGVLPKSDEVAFRQVLSQFASLSDKLSDKDIDNTIRRYSGAGKRGEFLQADTLMLLQYRKKYRILCVDLSAFSPVAAREGEAAIKKLDNIEEIRRLMQREINYLGSKSVFAKLRIDTADSEDLGFVFSQGLQRYFTAFKYQDKESVKLIQAGSYSESFYRFLLENKLLERSDSVFFNVVGYSDRGLSAIGVSEKQLDILRTCAQIYKHQPEDSEIKTARQEVLRVIRQKARRSFENGREFVKELLEIPPKTATITRVCHQERLEDFFSSTDRIPDSLAKKLALPPELPLRDAHAELIWKALKSEDTYIFLTGNPGIGKTTAIAKFLRQRQQVKEGFLFLYISPRIQVNLDIVEKFKEKDGEDLCDDSIFCINTNSRIVKDNFGGATVEYVSNSHKGNFSQKSVSFQDARDREERRGRRQETVTRTTEVLLEPKRQNSKGVLASLCEAIAALVNTELSNNIVATVAIQSLKKVQHAQDTLRHLDTIFKAASKNNSPIPGKMREISSRIKNIFIMVDEITGDDSGVEFLHGITDFVHQYQLDNPEFGFNTKIIIADASIVGKDVIQQHLADKSPEPDKIFFRHSPGEGQPLDWQQFHFNKLGATAINANSYPARSLTINYKVLVNTVKFQEDRPRDRSQGELTKALQSEIAQDINGLLDRQGVEQILVYIQNKRRLQELIDKLKQDRGSFEKNQDYLEIHASISEIEKQEIQRYKNDVKVVFMTSSASRGLSFPRAKHLLVEIARFQVERNLMEAIQVIYRGRGDNDIDRQDKYLNFYLSEQAVYYQDDNPTEIAFPGESLLNLLNLLLILKTCAMTRIKGAGKLGKDYYLMIPIGGKSVSAAGQTFSEQLAHLMKALRSERYRHPQDRRLKEVYTSLESLLDSAEFMLKIPEEVRENSDKNHNPKSHSAKNYSAKNYSAKNHSTLSYLSLRQSFDREFLRRCKTLDGLLDFPKLEAGLVSGSLLVVPSGDKKLEERYEIRLYEQIKTATPDLLGKMRSISYSESYPPSLRSAIKQSIDLVEKLQDPLEKTQWLEQTSQRSDRYYALPLLAFVALESFQKFFEENSENPEDLHFRGILRSYVRTLYPADKTLPISHRYREFPFVVFASFNLQQMREKAFSDKYLLTSTELNVLNLILSRQEEN